MPQACSRLLAKERRCSTHVTDTAVFALLFLDGAKLPLEAMLAGATHWRQIQEFATHWFELTSSGASLSWEMANQPAPALRLIVGGMA